MNGFVKFTSDHCLELGKTYRNARLSSVQRLEGIGYLILFRCTAKISYNRLIQNAF